MKRLLLFAVVAAVALNTVYPAYAQSPSKIFRIGYLSYDSGDNEFWDAFRDGLQGLGYVEGKNIRFERRITEYKSEPLPGLAAELVGLNVDVIVTAGTVPTRAAKTATSTIPIVMLSSTDPVGAGLVANLGRPGGNVTGLSTASTNLGQKRLELLKEISPHNATVAFLGGPGQTFSGATLQMKQLEVAAKALRLRVVSVPVDGPDDYERGFAEIGKTGAGSIIVVSGLFGGTNPRHRARLVALAAKSGLPTIYPTSGYVDAGGLISYGVDAVENSRRGAHYVDRILKGANPADMPVEQPTKIELVINLKTMKQLGLTIPESVLQRARFVP